MGEEIPEEPFRIHEQTGPLHEQQFIDGRQKGQSVIEPGIPVCKALCEKTASCKGWTFWGTLITKGSDWKGWYIPHCKLFTRIYKNMQQPEGAVVGISHKQDGIWSGYKSC